MRGKQSNMGTLSGVNRITPADAGKTVLRGLQHRERKDHPRGCGENTPTITQERNSKGSPPRMRGKLAVCRGDSVFNGITPADAGKTDRAELQRLPDRDHPRGCGENFFALVTILI